MSGLILENSMTKILNLDKITETAKEKQRELVIGGVKYKVPDMTVENFIETTKMAMALEKTGNVAEKMEATVDLICRSVPLVPRQALLGYSIAILSSIANFIRGEDVDEAEEVVAEGDAEKK
jgi:hypothetical protein